MNFLCLALPRWNANYVSSTVEILKEIGKKHQVIYIDYQKTWLDILKSPFSDESLRSLGIKKRVHSENDVLIWHLPPLIPVNWIKNRKKFIKIARFNGFLIGHSINRLLNKFGIKEYHMINAFTPVYGIVTQPFISPDKTIYYCYDEISAAKWLKTHGAWAEKIFIKKADTVIVSSIPLFNSKKAYNSNIHLVKNGVDFQLFQRFIDIKRFEDTSEFIIGYVGSIDDRLDYDLLIMLIESLPGVRFRFMGRCLDERAKKIWKYENVEYLGTLKPVELAKEVNKIHLGLIPFVKNEFTTNIYPLKINEYLACGCAVVSTHFSDLSDFEKDIYISEKYSEFIELCKIALTENNMDKALKRVEVAKGNSWSSRAELFLSSIANSN